MLFPWISLLGLLGSPVAGTSDIRIIQAVVLLQPRDATTLLLAVDGRRDRQDVDGLVDTIFLIGVDDAAVFRPFQGAATVYVADGALQLVPAGELPVLKFSSTGSSSLDGRTTHVEIAGLVEYGGLGVPLERVVEYVATTHRSVMLDAALVRAVAAAERAEAAALAAAWEGTSTDEDRQEVRALLSHWPAGSTLEDGIEYPDYDYDDPGAGGCSRSCRKTCPNGSCSASGCRAPYCATCVCHPALGIPLCGCG